MRGFFAWTTWLAALLALALLSGLGCVNSPSSVLSSEELTQDASNGLDAVAGATDVAEQDANAGAVDVATQDPVAVNAPICVEAGQPATSVHRAMFEALNQYRQENGLPAMIYSRTLEAAADGQVRDLWERDFFAHINPDGQNPGQRAVAAGFCHQYVGENIAAGQTTVDNVMTAWKNSPGHNANMLEPLYVYVGVSYSVDANGRRYWAQEFAYELP